MAHSSLERRHPSEPNAFSNELVRAWCALLSRAAGMRRKDEPPPASVVVEVSHDAGFDAGRSGNGFGHVVPSDAHGTELKSDARDGTVPRLWHTLPGPDAVRRRAAAFAFSSNGLPRKYDYRDWTATTFMLRDRAIGNFAYPWLLCVSVSAVWWALYEHVEHLRHPRYDLSEFDRMYALIFTALGFMLVFRLSRAAIRFWDCRTAWGTIAMRGRALCDDCIVNLGARRPEETDDVIKWFCAFAVGVKCHLRVEALCAEQLAGILTREEVDSMNASMDCRFHLFAANKMRRAVKRALLEEANDETARDETARDEDERRKRRFLHPQHSATLMHSARGHLDVLVDVAGAMERIKATRLPIVYVAHLRTFLLVYILSMPFVYVSLWGIGVVPATAIIAFALLGIEGAATECENPFSAKRTNHLGMDGFCENVIADLGAMLAWWRDESSGG